MTRPIEPERIPVLQLLAEQLTGPPRRPPLLERATARLAQVTALCLLLACLFALALGCYALWAVIVP